jgi:hypothetical protein
MILTGEIMVRNHGRKRCSESPLTLKGVPITKHVKGTNIIEEDYYQKE